MVDFLSFLFGKKVTGRDAEYERVSWNGQQLTQSHTRTVTDFTGTVRYGTVRYMIMNLMKDDSIFSFPDIAASFGITHPPHTVARN